MIRLAGKCDRECGRRAVDAARPGPEIHRFRAGPPGRLTGTNFPEILNRPITKHLVAETQPGRQCIQRGCLVGDGITFRIRDNAKPQPGCTNILLTARIDQVLHIKGAWPIINASDVDRERLARCQR